MFILDLFIKSQNLSNLICLYFMEIIDKYLMGQSISPNQIVTYTCGIAKQNAV